MNTHVLDICWLVTSSEDWCLSHAFVMWSAILIYLTKRGKALWKDNYFCYKQPACGRTASLPRFPLTSSEWQSLSIKAAWIIPAFAIDSLPCAAYKIMHRNDGCGAFEEWQKTLSKWHPKVVGCFHFTLHFSRTIKHSVIIQFPYTCLSVTSQSVLLTLFQINVIKTSKGVDDVIVCDNTIKSSETLKT